MRTNSLLLTLLLLLTSLVAVIAQTANVFDGTRPVHLYDDFYVFEEDKELSISTVGDENFQDNFKKFDPAQILEKGKIYWFKTTLKNEYNAEERLDRFYLETGTFSK